jgi:hypothetical protein
MSRLLHLELATDFFNGIGHLRPFVDVCAMSPYRPIATDLLHCGDGRKGPGGDIKGALTRAPYRVNSQA